MPLPLSRPLSIVRRVTRPLLFLSSLVIYLIILHLGLQIYDTKVSFARNLQKIIFLRKTETRKKLAMATEVETSSLDDFFAKKDKSKKKKTKVLSEVNALSQVRHTHRNFT